MSATKPLVLLLGAGKNIGEAVAKKFGGGGFNVALAARSLHDAQNSTGRWSYKVDLSRPAEVAELFAKVSKEIGIPNVVIYNAASLVFPPDGNMLSVSIRDMEISLAINTTSLFAAAQQAVAGFDKLPSSVPKSFLYTGNILNTTIMPALITLGVGKAASSHIIQSAATAYAEKDYHFYYVDERKEDGSSAGNAVSGPAHGEYFFDLASQLKQGPWQSTFVHGKGYVKF